MTAYSEGYHLYWRPSHHISPAPWLDRRLMKPAAWFMLEYLFSPRNDRTHKGRLSFLPVYWVMRGYQGLFIQKFTATAFSSCKIRSHVCFEISRKSRLNEPIVDWKWWYDIDWYVRFTKSLDPKAVCTMICTSLPFLSRFMWKHCHKGKQWSERKHFQNECCTADCVLLWSAPWWLNTLRPLKRWKDEESSVSCSASAVSLKLFKFVHRIPLPLFSAAKRSFEPTCHSAGRSTSMWLQTSLRWANIHAACPCSAYRLGTQTGHKQDNLIVPRCVPHGSVLSGFADGELSGVLPPDLLTWWQPGGLIKLQLTWFMHKNRLNVHTEFCFILLFLLAASYSVFVKWLKTAQDLSALALPPIKN